MKRIAFVISALSVLLIGCSKEQNTVDTEESNPQVEEGTVFSFDAVIEQAVDPDDTRATIDASTGNFSWSSTDAIAVQLTNNNFKTFTYDSSKGKFLATLSDSETIKDGGVAYYPATIAINGTPGSVSFTAGIQSGNPSGFPMRATVSLSDKTLSFSHLGGFVKLTVSRIPKDATTLKFEASGVTLSGSFAVTSDQISATTSGDTSLSYTVSGSTESAVFTLIVPVTTFSTGFTIRFLNASNQELYTKSTSKEISVGRAKMKNMASLTVPVSLYINTCAAWWNDANQYIHVVKSDDANTYYAAWPGTSFAVNSTKLFTHGSNSYYRVIEDLGSMTGKTANIIVNRGYVNGDFPYSNLYRATLSSVDLSKDVYVSLAISTSTSHKVFVTNWDTSAYNWVKCWDGTKDNWYEISNLSTEKLGDEYYHYYTTSASDNYIKGYGAKEGNWWSSESHIQPATGWDYFVKFTAKDNQNLSAFVGFPAVLITAD